MPRFVILHHDAPAGHDRSSHYDLMLEQGGVLWTWSLDKLPAVGFAGQAQALPDHRLAYLDFEGPLTGNRGSVERVEQGEYELLERAESRVLVRLAGKTLRGILELDRTEESSDLWQAKLRADNSAPDHR